MHRDICTLCGLLARAAINARRLAISVSVLGLEMSQVLFGTIDASMKSKYFPNRDGSRRFLDGMQMRANARSGRFGERDQLTILDYAELPSFVV